MITLRLYTYIPTPWLTCILDYYMTATVYSDRVINQFGHDGPYWIYSLK